jgi:hypothetical protein
MADNLEGRVRAPGRNHAPVVSPEVDGCDHNYVDGRGSTHNICVPINAPGARPVTCAYLADHGFTHVRVAPGGKNRKNLPVGRAGYVCRP